MQIEQYKLEFTPAIQAEFVKQNAAILSLEICNAMRNNDYDHSYACQQVADRIYDDCRISLEVGLLKRISLVESDYV